MANSPAKHKGNPVQPKNLTRVSYTTAQFVRRFGMPGTAGACSMPGQNK